MEVTFSHFAAGPTPHPPRARVTATAKSFQRDGLHFWFRFIGVFPLHARRDDRPIAAASCLSPQTTFLIDHLQHCRKERPDLVRNGGRFTDQSTALLEIVSKSLAAEKNLSEYRGCCFHRLLSLRRHSYRFQILTKPGDSYEHKHCYPTAPARCSRGTDRNTGHPDPSQCINDPGLSQSFIESFNHRPRILRGAKNQAVKQT